MPKCSNCGTELEVGQKFCFECGAPAPQVKKCPSCQSEIPLKMKFCPECGYNFNGSASANGTTLGMGDKNVIAGDVNQNITNTTINNVVDETKSVNTCAICGAHMTNDTGHTCPECGKVVCSDHFDKELLCCSNCAKLKREVAAAEAAKNANVFTDLRDGQVYRTVKIGNQVWLAENLRHKCDGTKAYDNDDSNVQKFGYLYTFEAAKNAVPEGWRLPSHEDFEDLFNYVALNGNKKNGIALKAKTDWVEHEEYGNPPGETPEGTDDFGFTALPAGECDSEGNFWGKGLEAGFWSSENSDENVFLAILRSENAIPENFNASKDYFYSVRLIKDEGTESSAITSLFDQTVLADAEKAVASLDFDSACEKLEKLFERNPSNSRIVNSYLRALRVKNLKKANEVATSLNRIVLEGLVVQVEYAVANKDLGTAEEILKKIQKISRTGLAFYAEMIWALEFLKATGNKVALDSILKTDVYSDGDYDRGAYNYARFLRELYEEKPLEKIKNPYWHNMAFPKTASLKLIDVSK